MSSARTAERLSRILAMLPWVISHPGASVDDICDRFGYDRKDLLRDLNIVFVCGLPGYGPGDLMEAYLDEDEVVVDMADYFSSPLRLTAAEALMMLAGGLAVLSAGGGSDALRSAVDKLGAVILPEEGIVDVVLPGEPGLVPELRSAAAERRVVKIVYSAISSGETTERMVEPWTVLSSMGNWYLSGNCRLAGGERLFRIDRIRELEVTKEVFPPPEEQVPTTVQYTPGVDDLTVHIRLSPAAAWVADYYPVTVIDGGDSPTIEFNASDSSVAARLLLRLGTDAEIVGGEDADRVTDALAALRERVLRRYR